MLLPKSDLNKLIITEVLYHLWTVILYRLLSGVFKKNVFLLYSKVLGAGLYF